ncbi:MAG: hypothetical protein USCGTAYLOR_02441 [Chromatiales bacterium USCg_Taylor]|nr:MAG: hypothetical protein USCGTAYLOR_02441 [Chromatiales bacterium USCg_Taylor]
MSIAARAWVCAAIFGLTLAGTSGARADGLFDRILGVLGISATPSQMRGDSDVSEGQIWMAQVEIGGGNALTGDSGYRWPVYEPGGKAVIALKGGNAVRISEDSGEVKILHKIPGVQKLVGADREDSDKLLVILDEDAAPLALLSLKTGRLTPLPYDPKSKDHRRMLSHVKGEERLYGTTRIYVKTQTKQGMEGTLEWTDVYVQQGKATPRNVSNCDGVSCGQPSLSTDGVALVYVRARGTP